MLLDLLIQRNSLDKAIVLLKDVIGRANCAKRFEPDTISFNTILKGCSKERQERLAQEMFALMRKSNVEANDVTYNSLIDCCVRAGKMHKAWILLKEM
jgi:pentatricopeptide repeat domain-containing protein 1